MCNCSSAPASICNQCQAGNQCGCPPNYDIMPQPVPCDCCPTGYTFTTTNAKYPDGICQADSPNFVPFGMFTAAVDCNPCAETVSSDCVRLPVVDCLGFPGGTLTDFLKYMCSSAFIELYLRKIGLDPVLGSGFCQLVQNCPPPGSGTTPIIGSISVTFP